MVCTEAKVPPAPSVPAGFRLPTCGAHAVGVIVRLPLAIWPFVLVPLLSRACAPTELLQKATTPAQLALGFRPVPTPVGVAMKFAESDQPATGSPRLSDTYNVLPAPVVVCSRPFRVMFG